jgi:hypothetical protein
LACLQAEGRRLVPSWNGVVVLFGLFVGIVFISSLITLVSMPSDALIRNVCYMLAFGVIPFLLGATQDKRTLEVLMSAVFCIGTVVALITIVPSSWTYDPAVYGRPIFLGADFVRLLLGPVLGISTPVGFYYAVTARGKAMCLVTLAGSALCFLSLYFSVMRMAYYLAFMLLMLIPVHLLVTRHIPVWRALLFVGIAMGLHLFCNNILDIFGQLLELNNSALPDAALPDAYYDMLNRSHLGELNWDAIAQQFSRDRLPLALGQSAIGLNEMFDAYPNDSTVIRARLYLEGIIVFFANPMFGSGASTFQNFSFQGPFSFPHSSILHVGAELGSIGLMVFVLLLIICGWRLLPHTLLIAPYLFFIAIDQTHGSYFSSWGTYFFMGVAASLIRNGSHNANSKDCGDFRLVPLTWKRSKL